MENANSVLNNFTQVNFSECNFLFFIFGNREVLVLSLQTVSRSLKNGIKIEPPQFKNRAGSN